MQVCEDFRKGGSGVQDSNARGGMYYLNSLLFSTELVVNSGILTGAGIITQHEKELSNLQEMFQF